MIVEEVRTIRSKLPASPLSLTLSRSLTLKLALSLTLSLTLTIKLALLPTADESRRQAR